MKKRNLKALMLIFFSLICIISTLIINDTIENDLICLILMTIFVGIEIHGLSILIKNKYHVN